ncbi:uncharacterized protein LOC106167875, partial [Lingula anatina]|uniref:Uncharacterized protein LOC106167875 n=1 Tax=Lingula anatina TaxID=7574 RepID=A0A1S3IVK2_LINAN
MNGYAEDGDYIVDTWLLDTDFSFEFGEHQDLPKLNKEQLRFILAVKAGKIKYVAAMIAEGFDVNFCTAWRGNPLCTAIENNRLDIAKLLLDSGAHTENALHLACLRSNIDLVSMLLSYGADPNAVGHGVGEDIPTCFIFALHVAQPLTIVLKLIEAGADVNAMCCQTLWTPLHLVCNSPAHSADIVQAILRAG